MECNVPTDIVFSFTGFALRGGKTGPHADGWGLALYDGQVRAQLPRADARLHQRHGRVHPQAPDQDAAGDRPRAPEDPRARVAREHAPVQARAVGPPLRVRAQRHAAARQAAAGCASSARSARPTASTPSAGCSNSCAPPSPTAIPRQPRRLWQRDRRAGRHAGRRGEVQLPARRRAPPVRALRDQALPHRPQGAVRARDAARRRDADRLLGGDDRRAIASPSSRPSR